MDPTSDYWIGLMSGTSLDGIDGVVATFTEGEGEQKVRIVAHLHHAFDPLLSAELLALNKASTDELHRSALAANGLAKAYAAVVLELLARTNIAPSAVRAIGAHGQTVRHRPGEFDGIGYTLQINNPALLAELSGIDVVADFRTRDVAAGGQGAPLVPAFHRYAFGRPDAVVAVLNLGGMSNISVVSPSGATLGFDCGPGNALMDSWCLLHRGEPFDANGNWAASGRVVPELLARMLSDPYFAMPAPKSTGRDRFDLDWLQAALASLAGRFAPHDVQTTLAELTAVSASDALHAHAAEAPQVLVCGGGAHNGYLMGRLGALVGKPVIASGNAGLVVDQVEAAAFAWLARCCVDRQPGNLAAVTGARGPRVLGAIYPAH